MLWNSCFSVSSWSKLKYTVFLYMFSLLVLLLLGLGVFGLFYFSTLLIAFLCTFALQSPLFIICSPVYIIHQNHVFAKIFRVIYHVFATFFSCFFTFLQVFLTFFSHFCKLSGLRLIIFLLEIDCYSDGFGQEKRRWLASFLNYLFSFFDYVYCSG